MRPPLVIGAYREASERRGFWRVHKNGWIRQHGGAHGGAVKATGMAPQTAATNSLANFTGQIKSKDEVSMTYRLLPRGQQAPQLNNPGKAETSSDGQDVLTPLVQEMAKRVLSEAAKK